MQADFWNGQAGDTWAREADALDALLAHFGEAVLGALAPRPGEHFVDVGCGAGALARELARRVGPGGSVVGVDVSRPLLAVARERGAEVRYVEGDAGATQFDTPFDGIVSRFGVMFFEDPVSAFANLRRVAPAGRLAFVCWRGLDENPVMTKPLELVQHLLPSQTPADPDAPGPFAFASRAKIERVLQTSGWRKIKVEPLDTPYTLGPNAEAATTMALTIGPLSRAVREAPEQREAVRNELLAAFSRIAPDGPVAFPSATWIVTAR